jgi:hypothetical protein
VLNGSVTGTAALYGDGAAIAVSRVIMDAGETGTGAGTGAADAPASGALSPSSSLSSLSSLSSSSSILVCIARTSDVLALPDGTGTRFGVWGQLVSGLVLAGLALLLYLLAALISRAITRPVRLATQTLSRLGDLDYDPSKMARGLQSTFFVREMAAMQRDRAAAAALHVRCGPLLPIPLVRTLQHIEEIAAGGSSPAVWVWWDGFCFCLFVCLFVFFFF